MNYVDSLNKPLKTFRVFIVNHVFSVLLPSSDAGQAFTLLKGNEACFCYSDGQGGKPRELAFTGDSVLAVDLINDTPKQIKEIKGILELSFYDQKAEKPKATAPTKTNLGKSAKKRKKK